MANLTDYLNLATLQQLQDAFTAVAQTRIRICASDGKAITLRSSIVADAPECCDDAPAELPICDTQTSSYSAPVMLEGEVVGRITLEGDGEGEPAAAVYPRQLRLLGLVANVITRLCEREQQLRSRAEDLAALYKLTGEFAGQRDLQGVLDMVAKTVVGALGAKACSIRLLSEDKTELVIKSVANLSPEYLNKGPILLSKSRIDQEVLQTGQPVYIPDERTDPRVLYKAEARDEGIVSALCAPMAYKGHAVGVIRVYMGEAHEFDWFESSLLKAIAAEAAAAIVNARLAAEAVRAADMQRQLRMAGEVQRRMIPPGSPTLRGFDVATIYVPCFEVGGDFYDFIRLPEENVGLAVCDVAGKGVRASLLMASVRASLRAHATNIYDMSRVLAMVNRDMCADTLISDFATLFYGVLDTKTRRLTYSNAGHLPPVLAREGRCSYLSAGGGLVGIDPQAQWDHELLDLRSGDVLMIYTDGLIEAMNFEDEPFGRERAEKALLAAIGQNLNANGIAKHVLWEMRRFAGLQNRLDDLTLIVIRTE